LEFKDKKILVLGAGISGIAVSGILKELGARVTLSDAKREEDIKHDLTGIVNAGVALAMGRQDESLLEAVNLIVLSPGISIYNPLVELAKEREITVISEVEVAYQLCQAPIVAVTGTNGKTTTTTLIGEMLKAAGLETVVGGNIGLALSEEVRSVKKTGVAVAEISSFQLEGVLEFKPHVAAVLNLTPDHIDRHRSMENYQLMKERIFTKQTGDDYVILNYDDLAVRHMGDRAPSQVVYFSRLRDLPSGLFVQDGVIKVSWNGDVTEILPVADIKIKGGHNVENALVACGCAYFMGVTAEVMAEVLRNFGGVEHRIEPVTEVNGVWYYNDSKATNPESAIKALEAFDGHIILIAGGRDKNTDLTEFMTLVKEKVDHLILLGEAKTRFAEAACEAGIKSVRQVDDFGAAVKLARSLAKAPQVVLLSPACSSYDLFNNYEERGQVFKEMVHQLR